MKELVPYLSHEGIHLFNCEAITHTMTSQSGDYENRSLCFEKKGDYLVWGLVFTIQSLVLI